MLSMPPATISWASPARIAWSASMTAFRPEPQTLLIVSAATVGAVRRRAPLVGRRLPEPGRKHVAHDDFVDGVDRQRPHGGALRATATAPSCVRRHGDELPSSLPIGVRQPAMM